MQVKVYYFIRENGRSPVENYLKKIRNLQQLAAIQAVIEKLISNNGRLPRPHAAHIKNKIWELRTHFGNRIFYFIQEKSTIILLDGYTKKRDRIEPHILLRIQGLYEEYKITKNRKPF